MKSTGITRKVDSLGRVVLPKGLRDSLNIKINDPVEILMEDNMIILRKFETGDIFTGSTENLIEFKGKKISKDTIIELAGIAGLGVYKIKR